MIVALYFPGYVLELSVSKWVSSVQTLKKLELQGPAAGTRRYASLFEALIPIMKFLPPEDYQARNIALFSDLEGQILEELPRARVEHVGASAVPGAFSKGDLDVFVGVPPEEMAAAIKAIQKLGFTAKQGTLRTPELCMLELEANDPGIAIQVVANGSRFEFFITFRDALIQSPELLSSYNQLKERCSGATQESYRDKKSSFIESVLDVH